MPSYLSAITDMCTVLAEGKGVRKTCCSAFVGVCRRRMERTAHSPDAACRVRSGLGEPRPLVVVLTQEPGASGGEAEAGRVTGSFRAQIQAWRPSLKPEREQAVDVTGLVAKVIEPEAMALPALPSHARSRGACAGRIGIFLSRGRPVTVDGNVDAAALSRIFDVLEQRRSRSQPMCR